MEDFEQQPRYPSFARGGFSRKAFFNLNGSQVIVTVGIVFSHLFIMLMAVLSVPGLIDLLKLENADYLRDQGRELSGKNRAFLFLFAVASAVVGYGFIYIQAFVGGRFLKSSGHDLTGTQLGLGVPGFAISERADSPTMTSKAMWRLAFGCCLWTELIGVLCLVIAVVSGRRTGFFGVLMGFLGVFGIMWSALCALPLYPTFSGNVIEFKLKATRSRYEVEKKMTILSICCWGALFCLLFLIEIVPESGYPFLIVLAFVSGGNGLWCLRRALYLQQSNLVDENTRIRDMGAPHVPAGHSGAYPAQPNYPAA